MSAFIGFDTASTITDLVLDRHADKGGDFACVYFKYMADATLQRIAQHNMRVVSVYETTAARARGGPEAGMVDGKQAFALAQRFHQPVGSGIYATADFDETAADDVAVLGYCRAFKTQIPGYRFGIYGNGALCQETLDQGIVDFTWLAGGSGMRGTKAFSDSGRATIVQDVGDKQNLNLGISIDSDTALVEDYGGWLPAVDVNAVTPATVVATAKLMQTQLQGLRLYRGAIDGQIGPASSAAEMQAYRMANGGV